MTTLNLFRHATDGQMFAAGAVIFSEGAAGDFMYVVQSGEVEITRGGKVIDSAAPGGLIGEMALIDTGPRSATAIARTDCTLIPIDSKRFVRLVQDTPYFALTVMKIMADRLRRRLAESDG